MEQTFDTVLSTYQQAVERRLAASFTDEAQPQRQLFEAMRYSLLAGGKRIRPVLVLEFCRLCGGTWEHALDFAAAIEMVHTYSLIHDDLPCMDNDDYRRGRLTNHKVYGEAQAVLAGDGLLTAAFSTIARADAPAEVRIEIVRTLATCAGEEGMVGGQVLDMAGEGKTLTGEELLAIHSRKTGALIVAACTMGVLAAQGSEAQLQAATDFANALGLAFQIRTTCSMSWATRKSWARPSTPTRRRTPLSPSMAFPSARRISRRKMPKPLPLWTPFRTRPFSGS